MALGTNRIATVETRPAGDGSGPGDGAIRVLELEADDREGLLRSWMRELLYWAEVEGFVADRVLSLEIEEAGETHGSLRARARLRGGPPPSEPIREIKGVTWHGLVVEKRTHGWFVRVIFDV